MSDFHVEGTQTVIATPDTTITLEIASSTRFRIYEFTSGFTLASPEDNLLTVTAGRFVTADGTGAQTRAPNPLDPADAAAITTSQQNHTTEPTTYTTDEEVHVIAQHMRATYRWVATPGREIVSSVTASTGIGFFAVHASSTPEHVLSLYFSE